MSEYGGAYLRHIGMRTRDIPGTVDFYTRVFGLRVLQERPGPPPAIVIGDGTFNVTIIPVLDEAAAPGAIPEGSELIHLGFVVPDLLASFRRCQEYGAPILAGNVGRDPLKPGDVPTESFKIADPNGNIIDVMKNPPTWVGVRI